MTSSATTSCGPAVGIAALFAAIALLRTGKIPRMPIRPHRPAGLPWDSNPRRDRSGAVTGTSRDGAAAAAPARVMGSPAAAPRSEH